MAVIHVTARADGLALRTGAGELRGEAAAAEIARLLRRVPRGAPVAALVHGFRFDPDAPRHDPHSRLFHPTGEDAWPAALGFSRDDPADGLCIAFGWQGRLQPEERRAARAAVGPRRSRAVPALAAAGLPVAAAPGAGSDLAAGMGASVASGKGADLASGMASGETPEVVGSMASGMAANVAPGMTANVAHDMALKMAPDVVASMAPGMTANMVSGMASSVAPGSASSVAPEMAANMVPGLASSVAPGMAPELAADLAASAAICAAPEAALSALALAGLIGAARRAPMAAALAGSALAAAARLLFPDLGFARVYARAAAAGARLGDLIGAIHGARPDLRVDMMAHSLGARVALHALGAPGAGRAILLGAAAHAAEARRLLPAPRPGGPEVINVISRRNDLFDAMFEAAAPAPEDGPRAALGRAGLGARRANWFDLQLDGAAQEAWLAARGHPLGPARRMLCHWSFYDRPGALGLWAAMLRDRARWSPEAMRRAGAPEDVGRRWTGFARPGRADAGGLGGAAA